MTVEEFIYDLPQDERDICSRLREIILSAAPDLEEKFYYGVPYYFRHKYITCIWPASSKAGPKHGVFIGFCWGNLLSNEQGLIEMGNRKRFGLIRYRDVKEINPVPLLEILHEAIMVDEMVAEEKLFKKKEKKAMK
jgi:hypothetical protein